MSWTRRDAPFPRQSRRSGGLATGVAALFGAVMSVVLVVGALSVAVVFAASLAFVLVLAVMLTALSAAAWRVRPKPAMAVRAGHAWVRYGGERRLP